MSYQEDRDEILKEQKIYQNAANTLWVVLFLMFAGVVWFPDYAFPIVILAVLVLGLSFYFVRTARKNNLTCSKCNLNLVPIVIELGKKSEQCYCPACGNKVI